MLDIYNNYFQFPWNTVCEPPGLPLGLQSLSLEVNSPPWKDQPAAKYAPIEPQLGANHI